MSTQEVNPEDVIARLATQIGQLHVELAMRDAALSVVQQRVTELEAEQAPQTAPSAP